MTQKLQKTKKRSIERILTAALLCGVIASTFVMTVMAEVPSGFTAEDAIPDWQKHPVTMHGIFEADAHWADFDITLATEKEFIGLDGKAHTPNEIVNYSGAYTALSNVLHTSHVGFNTSRRDLSNALVQDLLKDKLGVHATPISRSDLADVLYVLISNTKIDLPSEILDLRYNDMLFISKGVKYAQHTGLMSGDVNQNFNPNRPVTYGELAAITIRLDKLLVANQ